MKFRIVASLGWALLFASCKMYHQDFEYIVLSPAPLTGELVSCVENQFVSTVTKESVGRTLTCFDESGAIDAADLKEGAVFEGRMTGDPDETERYALKGLGLEDGKWELRMRPFLLHRGKLYGTSTFALTDEWLLTGTFELVEANEVAQINHPHYVLESER